MDELSKSSFSELAKAASLQPREALVEVHKSNKGLCIGVPREITLQEKRVALTPSSVQLLVNNGNEVWIETGAGKSAHFSDRDYSEAGAKICYSTQELYKAEVIVKVEPPTEQEIAFLQPQQLLISAIQLNSRSDSYIRSLMQKKISAIAFEFLKSADGIYPIVRSMSEIAGVSAISVAGELLCSTAGGKGEMLGGVTGIPPTEIVIIGAGTVGEYAARTAIGAGATVKVFDNSIEKLRKLQNNLGVKIFTSLIHPKILQKALLTSDVAIGCLWSEEGRSMHVVSEEMVSKMKPLSVIVDVCIDQGGCIETSEITTHENPTFIKHEVIHYCVPNINSRVSRTASYALSNILTPILLDVADAGNITDYLWSQPCARNGVYIYKGNLTNKHLGNRLNIYPKDLDLLIAAHA
ncbi:MAG: alanine dehydrogenase [Bacteroidia bacterium]|jgi:alanine dehydrogenase|nr:alanine dehydrogenase [Bacteroidia bacterium]